MSATLEAVLTDDLLAIKPDKQRDTIPKLARNPESINRIRNLQEKVETHHEVIRGDARSTVLPHSSVHLVVTSPPYWTLKEYPENHGQLGGISDYKAFLDGIHDVWKNCFTALVPGGRLVCVVGDVCLSRRQNGGRHTVVPLHASIQSQCIQIGFDNLAPIIWHKIGNAKTESGRSGTYLGKPFEPNGVIKNDIEFILMFRKPGGYRSPSNAARILSLISTDDHKKWFRQVWTDIPGASTRNHPAPFPVSLAERLIRMFSFVGDTVLDPFTGTASTQIAAKRRQRNSIGIDIEPNYCVMARERLGLETDL